MSTSIDNKYQVPRLGLADDIDSRLMIKLTCKTPRLVSPFSNFVYIYPLSVSFGECVCVYILCLLFSHLCVGMGGS